MSLKLICEGLISKFKPINLQNVMSTTRNLHTTAIASGKINRMRDRTTMLRTVVKKGDGTVGEKSIDLDSVIEKFVSNSFPNCKINFLIESFHFISQSTIPTIP